MRFVDPDGMNAAPIFDKSGELLGTDNEGWKGEAIVMDKKDFKQDMDHKDALEKGKELSTYGEGIRISDESWNTVVQNGGDRMTPTVINNSSQTIYYKPGGKQYDANGNVIADENPGYENWEAYKIGPNKDLYAPVDGVATQKYSDHVFKVPTGGTVTVTSEGGFDLDFYGFGGIGRMAPGIGWINREYILGENKNDTSWNTLFGKASEIGLRKY